MTNRARSTAKYVSTIALASSLLACGGGLTSAGPSPDAGGASAQILDAFFGLDDALPMKTTLICPGGAGEDGMPVTFSQRVAVTNPAASSFLVTTRSGATHAPRCATLNPATDASERHTVLLIGKLGDDPGDPPVRVDIVGSVPLDGGGDAKGLTGKVTALAAGPSLLLALRYTPAELPKTSCPSGTTKQIVQVTWSGGVTAPGGGDLTDTQRQRMHVTVANPDGTTRELTPFALADLGDNDNYVQLCLDDGAKPLSVRVEPGTCADPRGDVNAATTIAVTP
jgi:hypothetical protein